MPHSHFKDKEAIAHVIEAHAKGILASSEIHGAELPGHIFAGTDAAKEMSLALSFVWILTSSLNIPSKSITIVLFIFTLAWLLWKTGRSALLGWARLERLHRVVEQEKWEIEHNREQEREELTALYHAKGFEGKLLEDVMDVLMADGDRLLKVMVEEELGLSLESHEHPLKQSLGALIGSLSAAFLCFGFLFLIPQKGILLATLLTLAIATGVATKYEQNRLIPAIVWNIALGLFSFGTLYFLLVFFFGISLL